MKQPLPGHAGRFSALYEVCATPLTWASDACVVIFKSVGLTPSSIETFDTHFVT